MQIDYIELFFLFAALQAFVLLVGINLKKPLYSDLKKITSLLLVNIIIITVYYFCILHEVRITALNILGNVVWMSLCPLYFLLIKSLTTYEWTISKKEFLLFLLPAIFLLEGVAGIFSINIWQAIGLTTAQSYLDLWMLLFFSSSIFFIFRSFLLIKANVSEEKNVDLKWFTILFLGTLTAFATIYLIVRSRYTIYFELSLIALLALFVFILIYRVFKVLSFQKFFDLNNSKSVHNKSELRRLSSRLEEIMRLKKPYLDSNLTLSALADIAEIKSTQLTTIFSALYNSNFYEFINRYRVDYLESLILNDENAHYKISALAEQSGFRSKATFYKAFKAKHQLTPLQFIKKHRGKWHS